MRRTVLGCALDIQIRNDVARDSKGVFVVVGQMVRHTRNARMHAAAAQRLGIDDLAGRCLDQRWTAEKNRALVRARSPTRHTSPERTHRLPCTNPLRRRSAESPWRTNRAWL